MPIGLAPAPYSTFSAEHIDMAALARAPLMPLPFNPGVNIRAYTCVNQPNCQITFEMFLPGSEFIWTFAHDEFQYCTSGEMELEAWMPPLYSESVTTKIRAGGVYTIPVGTRIRFKILGGEPCTHVSFCTPSPGYPFPTYEQVLAL
jgi:hypothetical protein